MLMESEETLAQTYRKGTTFVVSNVTSSNGTAAGYFISRYATNVDNESFNHQNSFESREEIEMHHKPLM